MSNEDKTSSLPSFSDSTANYTEVPNPTFVYGQKVEDTERGKKWIEGEKEGWKVIDVDTAGDLYPLMISAITPRPVAFVNSISEDGTENLALFSWFNMVTQNPPLISISITNPTPARLKDSARNIITTKQFTVNLISEAWIENANVCAIDAPHDISEWPLSGLTKEPSRHIKASRVKESAFSMECELYSKTDIIDPKTNTSSNTLILGLVKAFHIRKDILNERGNVDPTKLKPVARLGDIQYTTLGQIFRMPRPKWVNEKEKLEELFYKRKALNGDAANGDATKL
ncbi:FMN-binding split barrel [Abortiporus biennis]